VTTLGRRTFGDPADCLGSVAGPYCNPLAWGALARRPSRLGWLAPRDRPPPGRPGPTARSPRLARLESVLFLAREPLGSRKLAQLSDLADGTEARTLVRALNSLYDREGSALRVVEVAGGFQLLTRPALAPWLHRLHSASPEVRLSAPAQETLAVVAYRQPVLRATVEAIRGVQCGEILRQLMERDLVRIVGRCEELGRPFLYGTTKYFLQVFGLRSLDELPRKDWFTPIVEAAEKTCVETLQPGPDEPLTPTEAMPDTAAQPTPELSTRFQTDEES